MGLRVTPPPQSNFLPALPPLLPVLDRRCPPSAPPRVVHAACLSAPARIVTRAGPAVHTRERIPNGRSRSAQTANCAGSLGRRADVHDLAQPCSTGPWQMTSAVLRYTRARMRRRAGPYFLQYQKKSVMNRICQLHVSSHVFQRFQTSCGACGGPGPWSLIRGGGSGREAQRPPLPGHLPGDGPLAHPPPPSPCTPAGNAKPRHQA